MSGGHFDYVQHGISDAASQLRRELADPESYASSMEPDIRESLALCASMLEQASTRLQRADWLLSGDDGEESYRRRLAEDLSRIA